MPSTLEPAAPRLDPAEFASVIPGLKTAGVRLTSPPAYWDDEIMQLLIREHPYIPSDRALINFTRKDDASGMATGYISIVGASHLSIPIVIRNWELSPLDILIVQNKDPSADSKSQSTSMDNNEVMPLNEDTFRHALDVSSIGDPVPSSQQIQSGYSEDGSSLRLPYRGRTVLASVLGTTEKQKEKLASLLQNRDVLMGFAHNQTGGVVDEWLASPEPKKTAAAQILHASIELPKGMFLELPANIEAFKTDSILAAEIFVDGNTTKTAVSVEAVDLFRKEKGRWLIFDDGSYARAPIEATGFKMAEKEEDAAVAAMKVATATPALRNGQTLMFCTDGIFTAPCKLARVAVHEDQNYVELTMTDDFGAEHRIALDGRLKTAIHDDARDVWLLPMTTQVIALGTHQDLLPMTPDKVASQMARLVPDQLVNSAGQWSLIVSGEPFSSFVDREKMAEVLGSYISNPEEIMKKAEVDGSVRFRAGMEDTIEQITKQASRLKDLPTFFVDVMRDIVLPLDKAVKLAAAIGDPSGVDAVLGAGFLTEDNVAEFVGLADQFETVVGRLCRLLLAIRLGFPGDESATVVAMKALSRVAERLRSTGLEGQPAQSNTGAAGF